MLSDGHAERGITDAARLREVAAGAAREQVRTSAVGLGLGYDEDVLGALAEGGGGDLVFAEGADEAVCAVASQVDHLLAQVAPVASVRIVMEPQVRRHAATARRPTGARDV